jgi:hypothetical protein
MPDDYAREAASSDEWARAALRALIQHDMRCQACGLHHFCDEAAAIIQAAAEGEIAKARAEARAEGMRLSDQYHQGTVSEAVLARGYYERKMHEAERERDEARAEAERLRNERNGPLTTKLRAADALADAVAAMVSLRQIDARSLAGDALLDYRDPPRSERSDALAALRLLVRDLAEGLEYAESIMWMAQEYADAGGRGGPEMRDYTAAKAALDAALARAREVG